MFYLTAKFQKKVINGFRDISGQTNGRTNERGLNSRFLRISFDEPKSIENIGLLFTVDANSY